MNVAYHFKCTHIEEQYDILFYDKVFNSLLGLNEQYISTKVLSGDLNHHKFINNYKDGYQFLSELFQFNGDTWNRIVPNKIDLFLRDEVFVVCFETITNDIAKKLHNKLIHEVDYLGAIETDYSLPLHWVLYGDYITPKFRILNKDISVFAETENDEEKSATEYRKSLLRNISFNKVNIEYRNYRYSMMDDNHNFQNAKRGAEWRKDTNQLFSTITDEIIAKLTDAAPDLTEKLWVITNTFQTAQTGEQYALAMTACRRLFEYVTDNLFPATDEIINGHSLKKDKYKNRLFEFASRQLKSEVNIDLIVTTTDGLFNEWSKLYELSNKGVHSDPHRQECRRCIIRTILLLDDLISIKNGPFETKVKASKFFDDLLNHIESSQSQ